MAMSCVFKPQNGINCACQTNYLDRKSCNCFSFVEFGDNNTMEIKNRETEKCFGVELSRKLNISVIKKSYFIVFVLIELIK